MGFNPSRLWVVDTLIEQDKCVCEFVDELELHFDYSTISKHLTVLKKAGIVSRIRVYKQVIYKLELKCILEMWS